jgi:hypothetical protein
MTSYVKVEVNDDLQSSWGQYSNSIAFSILKREGTKLVETLSYIRCRDVLTTYLKKEILEEEIEDNDEEFIPSAYAYCRGNNVTLISIKKYSDNKGRFPLETFHLNLHFLNELEESLGLRKTTITQGKDYLVLEGDGIWVENVFFLSFYTGIVRELTFKVYFYPPFLNDGFLHNFFRKDNWENLFKYKDIIFDRAYREWEESMTGVSNIECYLRSSNNNVFTTNFRKTLTME